MHTTDDITSIYDRSFFSEFGASNPVYARSCALIATEIHRRFKPKTAVDWGCGAGLHVAALRRAGVDAIGVDGADVPADLRAEGAEVRIADLARPIPAGLVPQEYDLSVCIDVLEHLSMTDGRAALHAITRGAGLLILSCAPPGQGGHHHVNEQPRRFWVNELAQLGWQYDRRETGAMEQSFLARRQELPLSWMYHNLCIYRPKESSPGRNADAASCISSTSRKPA